MSEPVGAVSLPMSDPTLQIEDGLVQRAIARDRDAFGTLYDRTVDRVYRLVFYRVGNAHDAEDLTQQVYLQAWRAIDRFQRTGTPFAGWLLTIAHNVVISHYRRRREESHLDGSVEIRDDRETPDKEFDRSLDGQIVRRTIARLKPEQQQVILLRFIDEMDYKSIAATLAKSEGAIRVIQYRALREMRRLLGRGGVAWTR